MHKLLVGIFLFLSLFAFSADIRNVYVDTDLGTGGADGTSWADAYPDLQDAENAEDGDIRPVGSDEIVIFHLRSTGENAETGVCQVVGWETETTNYIEFRTASTDRASASGYDATKFRLEVTDPAEGALYIEEDNVRVDGMQIKIIYSSAGVAGCIKVAGVGAGEIYVSNCYLLADDNGSANYLSLYLNDTDPTAYIYNNIMTTAEDIVYAICDTAYFYNNTLANANDDGFVYNNAGGTVTYKNNAVFNTADDFNISADTSTLDYNASDDADGNNVQDFTAEATDWNKIWTDYSTGDFSLINYTTAPCVIGKGTDDPSGNGYGDPDIDGEARTSPWDIGASEYIAVGGVAPTGVFGGPLAGPFGGPIFTTLLLLNIYLLIRLLRAYQKMRYWRRRALFYDNIDNLNAMYELNRYLKGEL